VSWGNCRVKKNMMIVNSTGFIFALATVKVEVVVVAFYKNLFLLPGRVS